MPKPILYMSHLTSRLDLVTLLPETGRGVEVGVWRGDFSYPFLQRWQGGHLTLVDPWAKLPDTEYDDVRNRDYDPTDYEYVVNRFRPLAGRAVFARCRSEAAVYDFPDGTLDFVYLDGNHAYDHVTQDIALWWPKLKPGGVLAGHDLFLPDHPGVTVAVGEFLVRNNLRGYVIHGERTGDAPDAHEAHSWYVRKPG